jgi:hypothetical protein
MLRPADRESLEDTGLAFEVGEDGGFLTVTIRAVPLPPGLEPAEADLLLRLPPGFPDASPDMFWLSPAIAGPAGAVIPGTEALETFMGRVWQRWSRHITGQWRPGIDNLGTYLAYVRRCLDQAAGRAA